MSESVDWKVDYSGSYFKCLARRLEQLKKYAELDKAHYPDSSDRQHVLDWAIEEIERLHGEQELSDLINDLLQELQICRKLIWPCEQIPPDGLVIQSTNHQAALLLT